MLKMSRSKLRLAVIMGNAVMTKAILVIGGWYFGDKLDGQYGTSPYLMTLGILIGIGFGLWYILFTAKRNNLT